MAYKIRKLEATELPLLLPLMKDSLEMEVDLSYLTWKLLDNPAGTFVGFAAFEEETGECAGYYGVIPERYVIEGKTTIVFQAGDVMTHSNHRRQGLFFKMATACFQYLEAQGTPFVIGFGGPMSTPGLEKLGWKHLFPIRYVGIPKPLCQAYGIAQGLLGNKYQYQPKTTYELASRLANNRREKFQQSYDAEFLTWRLSNPRLKYIYEEISYQGTAISYWCYSIINNKIFITDADVTSLEAAKSIRARIAALVSQQHLSGAFSFTQESTRFDEVLKGAGFIKNPFSKGPLSQKLPFMIRAAGQESPEVSNVANWAIRPIYNDSY